MKKGNQGILYIAPVIIYLLFFSIFPLIYSVRVSMTDLNMTREGTGVFIGFKNYLKIFALDSLFVKGVKNTSILILFALSLETVIGFIVAKLFFNTQGMRFTNMLKTIYIIPIMITPLIYGLIWLYMLNPTQGIVNYLFSLLHIPAVGWFGNTSTALLSIIIIDIWQYTPFVMIILLSGLLSINKDLFEAAKIDGANWYQNIIHVEIPSIRSVIGIAVILRLMDLIRTFDVVYATTRGGPGGATEVLSMYSYRQSFLNYNIGLGTASAIVALIITLILSNVFNKYLGYKEDGE